MKIDTTKYEGYVWMSDSTQPTILEDGKVVVPDDVTTASVINEKGVLELIDDANPFVIEAQLYDRVNRHSIAIKYIDGKYIINEKNVQESDLTSADVQATVFESNRMNREEKRKLAFLQYWAPEADPLCEGMPVLQPAELVFVGFKKEEK